MKESRRIELEQMLDAAEASGDAKQIRAVRRTIDRENLECTAHTAERVKRVEADVLEIKSIVSKISLSLDAAKNKVQGAKMLWDVLKVIVGAGGGAFLLKICGG